MTEAPDLCPTIVSQSLAAMGTSCASTDPNTTCYAHPEVAVTPANPSAQLAYNEPGDRLPLSQVQAVETGPLDVNSGNWGVNLMNVSANIPTALSQKGVVFVQFGGVEVKSAVDPSKAISGLATGIVVTTTSPADLLTWPAPSISGHASNLVTSLPAGASLSVDAISPAGLTGPSVRAVYTDPTMGVVTGWVLKSAVSTSVDLSGLPVIGPDDLNYFQSFTYDVPDVQNAPDCPQSTPLLMVQGPKNASADLVVFNQPIRIESTIVLRVIPGDGTNEPQFEWIDLTGMLVLFPDSPQQILIPPGFKTTVPLSEIQKLLAGEQVTLDFTTPVPATQDELDALQGLQDLPSNETNYTFIPPIVIQASGSGDTTPQLVSPDPSALDAAQKACAAGLLPADTCQYLGF
ncbi:MAG TPA: hypothetical protein VHD90_18655 [Phototrophicaceae bacterium]|nr:hypothetical protein [Phototrophicaceae bacterium]